MITRKTALGPGKYMFALLFLVLLGGQLGQAATIDQQRSETASALNQWSQPKHSRVISDPNAPDWVKNNPASKSMSLSIRQHKKASARAKSNAPAWTRVSPRPESLLH